tara:strand:- start:14514 stop:16622 length:2109 start_codon:yes stop_codon:yes gene_type:complete
MPKPKQSEPPIAKKEPTKLVRHGYPSIDDYHWLRAKNWQSVIKNPELLPKEIYKFLEDENNWCDSILAPADKIRRELILELGKRLETNYESAPRFDENFAYLEMYNEGAEYAKFIRKKINFLDSIEILLDAEVESKKYQFYNIHSTSHSPDHRFFSWAEDTKGSEEYSIKILDTKSKKLLNDRIHQAQGPVIWTSDSKRFYYIKIDQNLRPSAIYEHTLGQESGSDRIVYLETNPEFFVNIKKSENSRFAVIVVRGHNLTSESHLLCLETPSSNPTIILPRSNGHDYDVTINNSNLFIRTNLDGAIDYKIVVAPLNGSLISHWVDIVQHKKGRTIEQVIAFKDYLVWLERQSGLARIVIKNIDNNNERIITFPNDATYDVQLSENSQFKTNILRYSYSSLAKPLQIIDHDIYNHKNKVVRQQSVPSGHQPDNYTVKRVFASASDGNKIPISLIYRQDLGEDNPKPLILYGYGAYGTIIPADFSVHRFSLIDRGFTWAIAHVRGGSDLGLEWYMQGKLNYKQNTFTDFISSAEYLCENGYTSPKMIGILGRSAGGMLIGATVNLRPDLFKSAVAEVPFVDVLNTMYDESLPLTPPEWTEWGNPKTNLKAFDHISSYSPYDNIQKNHYPHILATGGLSDPRVTYWEPAKWVAKLRANNIGCNDILLRTNMKAGHGGSSGRFKRLEEIALTYSFFLKTFGMIKKS